MRAALFRPGDRPLLNLALFGLTVCTTFTTFFYGFSSEATQLSERASSSLMFSGALVLILGCHEMGHYLYARRHGVDASLPYFIPLPPPLGVGTLGAVIRIRSRIPNRNALVDIGAAGPLAGLAVALPLLIIGFAHSEVVDLPRASSAFPGELSLWNLGQELLLYLKERLNGPTSDAASLLYGRSVTIFGDNLFMMGIQRLVMGPLPPGKDINAHPLVIAGWFGLLVTMLNLIPIGQLDGGHVAYAFFGDRAQAIGKVMAWGLFGLCLFWSAGWLVWLLLSTRLIGFKHPEVLEPIEPPTRGRRIVAALCLLALVCCIIPVPISQVLLP